MNPDEIKKRFAAALAARNTEPEPQHIMNLCPECHHDWRYGDIKFMDPLVKVLLTNSIENCDFDKHDEEEQIEQHINDVEQEEKQQLPAISATLKMTSWNTFRTMIQAMSVINDEATIELNSVGLTYRAMDPRYISMMTAFLSDRQFDKFDINKDFKVTFDSEEMKKSIKDLDKNDELTITTDDSKSLIYQLYCIEHFLNFNR